ncbi:MAG: hypothetical protein E5X41_13090 [Mesorhizobium sp.]|uniref:hypothetical protein n=1 Tax=Mesorhizobium sp. TaxID=1871066 RepID=UPI000FE692FD|nr:hypothetical protein [Mesorhizobium sp.]RWP44305.1 MAG: hypothetical protein EOR04_05125 [Mesorhizobium sp.]TIQ65120.1 MAG: hypothetical protein E5X41_13090 [Mesorhizobium sp.]
MYSHQNVTLRGFHWEVSSLTFNLATGITNDHIGRGVSIDTSGANKVKLAADGDTIIGRLASVENRTVEGSLIGAVELQFANTLPIKAAAVVAIGDTVVGAGAGEVKAAATPDHSKNFVVEIIGTNAVVVKV